MRLLNNIKIKHKTQMNGQGHEAVKLLSENREMTPDITSSSHGDNGKQLVGIVAWDTSQDNLQVGTDDEFEEY